MNEPLEHSELRVPRHCAAQVTPPSRRHCGRGRVAGKAGRIPFLAAAALVSWALFGSPVWADSVVADAAQRGDLETVRRLLRGGSDANAAQGDGMTALHWAAERDDAVLAEVLIYAGANVGAGTRIGRYTPLHLAARNGHAAVTKVLLKAGSDPLAVTTNSGVAPLHLAAAAGHTEVISALLDHGAEVDAREASWKQTPLVFAAANGRVEAVRLLLEAGADPGVTTHTVDVAEREEADRAAERSLSEFLADFRKKEGGGSDWSPSPSQVQAAIEGSRQIQRRWPNVPRPGDDRKAQGSKPAQAENAETDQPEQSQKKYPAGEKEASATGLPPDKPQGSSESVTYNAEGEPVDSQPQMAGSAQAGSGAAETVTYNAEGEPVDVPVAEEKTAGEPKPLSYGQLVGSWGGLTPLLHAIRQGHTKAALALIDGGADINQTSAGDQTTPLLMAALNGHFDLALVLLERGADPNLASDAGTTPLFAVLERTWAPRASYAHPIEHQQQAATHLDVMKALLEAGADPNVRLEKHLWYMEYTFGVLRRSGIDLQGATPFWRAAHALDVEAMRLLKDYGADPNIPTAKPPQRRRRPAPAKEKQPSPPEDAADPQKQPASEAAKQESSQEKPIGHPEKPAAEAPATDTQQGPAKAKAKAEKAVEEEEQPGYEEEEEEEEDHSGIPPVPVGGPSLYPIHAAAGAGYGQAFAGNAHRYVPDNWLNAVKFLVKECGADVNIRDANAYTALHHAAARGDNELILYLVAKGADVTVVSRKGQTTADMANGPIQRVPPYLETVKLLEKLGSKNNNKCVSC